jgi:hypothetical protein
MSNRCRKSWLTPLPEEWNFRESYTVQGYDQLLPMPACAWARAAQLVSLSHLLGVFPPAGEIREFGIPSQSL